MKKDTITRYIELMYSEKSSFNDIQDLDDRKKAAAVKAGMDPLAPTTIAIMALKNETVNRQIFSYLSRTQSNAYINLISDQQLFWEIQFDKMQPSEGEDPKERLKNFKTKAAMSKESKELLDRIAYLYREIFKHEDAVAMGGRIIKMMTPEQRVKKNSA